MTHGDPRGVLLDAAAGVHPRETNCDVVTSDLSIDSGYAVQLGIGTSLRDTNTMYVIFIKRPLLIRPG